MKKVYLLCVFILSTIVFLYRPQGHVYAAVCVEHTGTFTVTSGTWPANATATLQCTGPSGGVCPGDIYTDDPAYDSSPEKRGGGLRPGDSFNLNHCDCTQGSTGRCLQVYNLPPGCTVVGIDANNSLPNTCRSNNDIQTPDNFVVECTGPTPTTATSTPIASQVPPTATSAPPTSTPVTETPVPGSTGTPPVGSACNQTCDTDTKCQSMPNPAGCTACLPNPNNPSEKTCQPPGGITPTPTGPTACTENVTSCNIPSCDASQGGNPYNCSACNGGTCSNNGANSVCTSCGPAPTAPPPVPTNTPQPPTPTPTPAFVCKCANISNTSIVPGGKATITGQAQVIGPNRGAGQVNSIQFRFTDDHGNPLVPPSGQRPASFVRDNGTGALYQATWDVSVPGLKTADNPGGVLIPGQFYRIFISSNEISCGPKTTAFIHESLSVVLGAAIQPTNSPNFFQRIGNFISSLFNNPQHKSPAQLLGNAFTANPTPPVNGHQTIKTFQPAIVTYPTDQNSCKFIRFQAPQ